MLMNQYYGDKGIGYRLTRVVVASSDFSTHPYSYNDVQDDFEMVNFNLTIEDYLYKLPYIKQALALSKANDIDLKLFCTAWGPPGWMKQNGEMQGGSPLKGAPDGVYYKAYATYYKRYFEEYDKEGIRYWMMTPTNEPREGRSANYSFQVVNFTSEAECDFVKYALGPMLRSSDLTKDMKLFIGDENRYAFPDFAETCLGDAETAQYIDGFAWHWYEDENIPPTVIDETNQNHPGYMNLYTEACGGWKNSMGPLMGEWERADEYAHDIIEDISHGVQGWVDWNIVLDGQGGPDWVNNFVDAPIIANYTSDEFIKQPMFYVMGHFSKFVLDNYTRVDFESSNDDVEGVAFIAPGGDQRVVVLHNLSGNTTESCTIQDQAKTTRFANIQLPPASIATVIYSIS
ncbi:unnamed protein product, partial [Mesorhabditis spiculigera]